MSRRNIAVLVLALASFALSACADVTSPNGDGGDTPCQVVAGSSTCID